LYCDRCILESLWLIYFTRQLSTNAGKYGSAHKVPNSDGRRRYRTNRESSWRPSRD
jgi:hypothetical protein